MLFIQFFQKCLEFLLQAFSGLSAVSWPFTEQPTDFQRSLQTWWELEENSFSIAQATFFPGEPCIPQVSLSKFDTCEIQASNRVPHERFIFCHHKYFKAGIMVGKTLGEVLEHTVEGWGNSVIISQSLRHSEKSTQTSHSFRKEGSWEVSAYFFAGT